MKTLTYEGYGIFDLAQPRMALVDFAKTKKEAIKSACEYRKDGEDIVIYKIMILRDMHPIKYEIKTHD